MKIRKIVLLAMLSFILTGCEVTYNLTVKKDLMIESADFIYEKNDTNEAIVDDYIKNNTMAYYDMDSRRTFYYESQKILNEKNVGLRLNYEYNSDKLQNSSLLDRCYYKKSIVKTNDYILISTDGKATCFYTDDNKNIDKLTINIKTDLEVVENNADKVSNNTYTWYIDEDNYKNKPVNIKINLAESGINDTTKTILIIISVVLAISIIFVLFIKHRNKKNNKI